MNPYTLTLLRHGDIDHEGRLVGRLDLALNERGRRQLAASWQRVNALAPVTAIASSPLKRCREFAVQQALAGGVPLKLDERLAECDFGTWDGMALAELAARHPDWSQRLAEGSLDAPGGEDFDTFRTRVLAGFAGWMSEARGSHRVLVSHGGVITVLLAELLGTGFNVARLLTVQRGGFAQLSILDGHPAYLLRLEPPCAD
ncbi:phosphoglycerate mutase [Pseudogulbenkiania sp. NH8B]|uniref:histidine phosphatase family protein n=1 Tax=Pseudogulbenkiania sp. (strain NH8B) TaxID=748280 RepID=UPI000227A2DC|nr:histidine phosphatase family protein [Pseudogulbenkiania sp. NH8B]BAK78664.1 phosphoglycerate mutase [Pseudogulbenkiania sp. NH8B]